MLSVMRGQFDPSDDKELVTLIEAHFPKDQVATPPESPQPATINVVGAKHRYSGVGANPCNYKFPGTSQSCGMLITDLTVHWP